MKSFKMFLSVMALAVISAIGFSSCSNDMEPQTPVREGEVDVVMTTSLPQSLQSYALTSAEGGLKNLENEEGLAVRYIMEIYPKGSETAVQRKIVYKTLEKDGDYRTASFSTRLLAAEYKFVFWADIVKEVSSIPYRQQLEGIVTPCYGNTYFFSNKNTATEPLEVLYRPTDVNTSEKGDLKTIRSSKVGAAVSPVSSEMYDGYSCTESVDLRTEPTAKSFTLKRPFAKLRVVSTDKAGDLVMNPNWAESLLQIQPGCNIPNRFNALTGKSTIDSNVGNGYWCSYYVTSGTYEDETGDEHTIGVFYLPVSDPSYNLDFNIEISADNGSETAIKLPVPNVPLAANKLTTIKGRILSQKAEVTITINDEFEDDETIIDITGTEVSDVEGMKNAMTGKDQTIVLTSNVTKENGFELDFSDVMKPVSYSEENNTTPVYGENNDATLTLSFASIEEGAVLTFRGANAPKKLNIKTNSKCSLRIDLLNTTIDYGGTTYKYIITNAKCANQGKENGIYEAFFITESGQGFLSSDYDSHTISGLTDDFQLKDNAICTVDADHSENNYPCTFIDTVKNWLTDNSKTSVWDFVAEYQPTSTE